MSPGKVSWLSFVIMGLVVTGIGLVGTAFVVGYLADRMTAHGVEHNREMAGHIRTILGAEMSSAPNHSVTDLQEKIDALGVSGFRVLIIDRLNRELVSDSHAETSLPIRLEESWLADVELDKMGGGSESLEGTGLATGPDGHPMLIWLEEAEFNSEQPRRWLLGVASDQKDLAQFLGDLRWHLYAVIVTTFTLIALLGYFSVRGIGRAYERNLEAQVTERTKALELAHEEVLAKTRLATIGQTASVLAHEMRNPLASIKLALSAVEGIENVPERTQRRLALVLGEVGRLDELLSDTLDYVRPIKLSNKPVAFDRLISQVLREQKPLLDEHRIKIHRRIRDECVAIRLDEHKMHQVFLNLIKNAIEASPMGGNVTIELRPENDEVVFTISNEGEPMDSESRQRAFDLFYTTKAKGSGLGLGLVKRVVEEHGGSVSLTSEAESGTQVMLRLPVSPRKTDTVH